MRYTVACPGDCGRTVAWLEEDERSGPKTTAGDTGLVLRTTQIDYCDMWHEGHDCEWFREHRRTSEEQRKKTPRVAR
jgi:hypothetical protein